MTENTTFTALFAAGLTNPTMAVPADVIARDKKGVTSRYNVYRNNVTVSLINALASIYPATQRITGTDFFRAMARFYVRASLPESPVLAEYGQNFPDFIDHYEYAQDYPWLGDVARIERAWLNAWHAADLPVLLPDILIKAETTLLADMRFVPHPATCVLRSCWPVTRIFSLYRVAEPEGTFCSDEAEDTLITRPESDVVVTRLPSGGATFLTTLCQGHTLGEATIAALEECADFDLSANLAGMISAGVFTAILNGD